MDAFDSVLASWDAEEYGIVGSTEWIEEYVPWLWKTAVSYINLDTAVLGPIPELDGTPELWDLGVESFKKVTYPFGGNASLLDAWEAAYDGVEHPDRFAVLGGGSDFTGFVQNGIGAVSSAASPITTAFARASIDFCAH